MLRAYAIYSPAVGRCRGMSRHEGVAAKVAAENVLDYTLFLTKLPTFLRRVTAGWRDTPRLPTLEIPEYHLVKPGR